MRWILPLATLLALMTGCGTKPVTTEDFGTQIVTLPNGNQVRVEVMISAQDLMRGMMFRDSLAPDRGMLFIHGKQDKVSYWMYQVRIPLDIIWMDSTRRIVEISAETPPCKGPAADCPSYGGHQPSQYVLELAGGMATKYGLKVGDTLRF
jgi:uncharacterized membrane protein (UPF0127 family)